MKKTFLIFVGLVVVFGLGYILVQNLNSTPTKPFSGSTQNSSHPDLSNATFTFDDGPITLSRGVSTKAIVPGSALSLETTLTDIVGYGDINGDKKDDAVAVLVQTGGGSGVFIYLMAYVSGPLNYKGSNAVFVGDRIEPTSISINNGTIILKYLDRKPNEPYAAEPTVSATKQYIYTKGTLSEK